MKDVHDALFINLCKLEALTERIRKQCDTITKKRESTLSDYEPRISKPAEQARGSRHNSGKPRPSLIPVEWIEGLMAVMEEGAKKYAPGNWQKGMPFTEVMDCLERHMIQFKKKEDLDPDGGSSTILKVAVNALFIYYYQKKGLTQFDDR